MAGEKGSPARVRPARPDDLPRLWEMAHGLARYEKLEHEMVGSAEGLGAHIFGTAEPHVDAFVAEFEGRLVGYALVYPVFSSFHTSPMLWLEDLFVEEALRGGGHGLALMAEVARFATARGMTRMGWLVLDWNQPSIAFYERLGARPSEGWYQYGISGAALQELASAARVESSPSKAE